MYNLNMRDIERFIETEKFMEQLLRPVYGMYWMKVKQERIFFPILRNAAKAKTHLERDILLSQITDLMKDMKGYESVLQLVYNRQMSILDSERQTTHHKVQCSTPATGTALIELTFI